MNEVVLNINTRALLSYFQGALGKIDEVSAKVLRRGSQEGTREAKRHTPKAETLLTNSIRPVQKSLSHAQIIAGVHYAKYVEEGTKKDGWVPDQAMEDWMRVKGITPRDADMSQEELMYLIQTHIFYHGTPAQPFFKPAAEHIRKALPGIAQRIILANLMPKGRR